jgi:hypothetical protein
MAEIPDWVDETPESKTYDLIMWEGDGGMSEQEIRISRAEFVALKAHLAALRGYTVTSAEDCIAKIGTELDTAKLEGENGLPENSPQQIATYLAVARWLYRHCPEAVVCTVECYDEALEDIADTEAE